jgi:glycine hydroxymethyltransferase
MEAQGSQLTNKYAEGYPGKRYYGGCEHVDVAEQLAIDRLKKLFGADAANVQPNSGSQANQAVLMAFAKPGDTIMGMSLADGRPPDARHAAQHVRQVVQRRAYGLDENEAIDYERWKRWRASTSRADHRRRLGLLRCASISSASPRWRREVGAIFMVDMAHYAGLIAAGATRTRCRTPMSSPRPRTRPCAARAAASS